MTDFGVHFAANEQGQAAFNLEKTRLSNACWAMYQDSSLAAWCNSAGAQELFLTFKRTWEQEGDHISTGLGLVGDCLANITDIAHTSDLLAAKAWGSGYGV
jgi:hypothetical protein